jgi:ATP-dependent DNA helicase PIF1
MSVITNSSFEELKHIVLNEKRNVFLSGAGGCGKSYLVQQLKKECVKLGVKMTVTSTTGISAVNIGGSTIHSWSGIGISTNIDQICNTIVKFKKTSQWKETKILCIDEISMLGKQTFEVLHHVAQNVRRNFDKPFGGLQVILTGDFMQLAPVKDEFCFKSTLWESLNLHNIILKNPFRFSDMKYYEMLQRIRHGKQTVQDISLLQDRVEAYKKYQVQDINPTTLFSTNINVDEYNNKELLKIREKEWIFTAKDSDPFATRIFNTSGIPEVITLKRGAQVMLTRNLDLEKELCNGSRGVIMHIETGNVYVKFNNGDIHPIAHFTFEVEDGGILRSRVQMPLKLAYALTIHKSQGSSLDCAIIDLGPKLFSSALAYVALSRVRSLDGLYISSLSPTKIKCDQEAMEFDLNLLK